MLHEFITRHRTEIVARCATHADRTSSGCGARGMALFVDQLVDTLGGGAGSGAIGGSAALHAADVLQEQGTLGDLVRHYGSVCQVITGLATETQAAISTEEFRHLNLALDDAIAAAVTEYARLRDRDGAERVGRVTHDMRDLLHRSLLAYDMVTSGSVALQGATAQIVTRSLGSLSKLIDRELSGVRIGAGLHHAQTFLARDFVQDAELVVAMDARANGRRFAVECALAQDVALRADRQVLESVLGNLLTNAVKFTRKGGTICLRSRATHLRVVFEVQDECGGLPVGQTQELFRPFAQAAHDRRGVGLGLAICHDGALANGGTVAVRNMPGEGCVFALDLPRYVAAAGSGA